MSAIRSSLCLRDETSIFFKVHISHESCLKSNQYYRYYFPISEWFRAAASPWLPDNSHSSAMHFSWHLQPCAITKKASTFLEWHLGAEWDILSQHYNVPLGTNIHSAFMEMLTKHRVAMRWVEGQKRSDIFISLLQINISNSEQSKPLDTPCWWSFTVLYVQQHLDFLLSLPPVCSETTPEKKVRAAWRLRFCHCSFRRRGFSV